MRVVRVRACVRVCMHACVFVCVHACMRRTVADQARPGRPNQVDVVLRQALPLERTRVAGCGNCAVTVLYLCGVCALPLERTWMAGCGKCDVAVL